jgi:hypothetical protein
MKIIFLLIFMISGRIASSQTVIYTNPIAEPKSSYILKGLTPVDPFAVHLFLQSSSFSSFAMKPIPMFDHQPSLFCKLENKMEAKSKLAPRFRLGSFNYTQWMEGKGELYTRYYK